MNHPFQRHSFIFIFLLTLTSCSSAPEQEINLRVEDTLYVFDEVSNVIHAYDLEQEKFVSFVQYANLEKFRSNDFDLSIDGKIYVSTYGIPGFWSTPSSQLKVFDASTLVETDSIKLDFLYPDYFDLGANGTLYMAHGYEFYDESGWAVSVYEQGADTSQEVLKVAGAPSTPEVLSDGKAYFPYFGAGDKHYGDSNVMVYDPLTKDSRLLFSDNFTYVPPRDLFWDGTSYYATFNGIQQETMPYFTKPENHTFVEADKVLMIFSNINDGFELIPLDIQGSDMEIIVEGEIAYVYYCDSAGAKTSGLALVDLTTKKIIEDYDLGGGSFSEEILLIEGKLYITNRSKQRLDIFDTLTRTFTFIEIPEGGTPYDLAAL
jgi:hypothetical protein